MIATAAQRWGSARDPAETIAISEQGTGRIVRAMSPE
jgi:hypothetical protein